MKSIFWVLLGVVAAMAGAAYVMRGPDAVSFGLTPDTTPALYSDATNAAGATKTPEATSQQQPERTAALTAPEASQTSQSQPALPATPRIDTVRIDKDGSVILAGRTGGAGLAWVVIDGQNVQQITTDDRGEFVAMFDLPSSQEVRVLTVHRDLGDGDILESENRILIAPETINPEITNPETTASDTTTATADTAEGLAHAAPADQNPPPTTPPVALMETAEGVAVVQNPSQGAGADGLSLDAITYNHAGDVTLQGRGVAEKQVQIYVNNQPVSSARIVNDGQWNAQLSDIASGTYTLRIDEVEQGGKVRARIETPFKREDKTTLSGLAERTGKPAVTVQPGSSLWAISRERYGEGTMYVRIFEANKERIRDPDLIYPGQVFDLPN